MKTLFSLFFVMFNLIASLPTLAQPYQIGNISIQHPWAKESLAGQRSGGGYFVELINHGAPDKLIAAQSDVANIVELHTMTVGEDHIMRMTEVSGIDLPTNEAVNIRPGAFHIMFIDLKAPLKAGQTFPVTLVFEKAGKIEVMFSVEAKGYHPYADAPMPHDGHHPMPATDKKTGE